MEVSDKKIIEAILFVADEPVPAGVIGQVLEKPKAEVETYLKELSEDFASDRGINLHEVAGGWRLLTHADCAPWLERFVTVHRHGRVTGAALEVLAIIAYRGPISRGQIADIRGVDSDGVVRNLIGRDLVSEHRGSPSTLTVSSTFLERMDLKSADELPPLADFMPDADFVEDMEAKLSPGA
jgi:segregation and condensation protein B